MRSVAIAVCGLLLSGVVSAGELNPSRVSAKAKWVAHLDVQGMLAGACGQECLKEIEARGHKEKIAAFAKTFGFDPTKDLRSITLWGENYEPNGGVAVIEGTLDKEKLLALARLNEGHGEANYGDYHLQRWTQKPENNQDDGVRWGTFWRDDVLLVTRDQKVLENAIDTLGDKAATMSGKQGGVLGRRASRGAFLTVAGTDFQVPAAAKRPDMAKKKLPAGFAELGEADGTMFLNISVTAATEAEGEELRQVVQGIAAFMKMSLRHHEGNGQPLPHWAPLASAITIGGKGSAVSMSVKLPTADVIQMMKAKAAEKAKKAEAKPKP